MLAGQGMALSPVVKRAEKKSRRSDLEKFCERNPGVIFLIVKAFLRKAINPRKRRMPFPGECSVHGDYCCAKGDCGCCQRVELGGGHQIQCVDEPLEIRW